jgi:hypothetical protein
MTSGFFHGNQHQDLSHAMNNGYGYGLKMGDFTAKL